jgi:hypothetical protein
MKMKTSEAMREMITKLAEKHGLDLTNPEARLRLDMPGFDRLVIEKSGEHLVSVAHYFEQSGELLADPKIVFFINDLGWIPIEITQALGGHRVYAIISPDGQEVALINTLGQMSLALFAEDWARNIETQGWLEEGIKWVPCDPVKVQTPDLETLMEWEAEGGCEAVDGCWVEPDGVCPHGSPSWLLVLGLI